MFTWSNLETFGGSLNKIKTWSLFVRLVWMSLFSKEQHTMLQFFISTGIEIKLVIILNQNFRVTVYVHEA